MVLAITPKKPMEFKAGLAVMLKMLALWRGGGLSLGLGRFLWMCEPNGSIISPEACQV